MLTLLENIILWLLPKILNWLFDRASSEIKKKSDEIQKENERKKADAENLKSYQSAANREEKIKAATDLLNGNSSK